MKHKCLLFPAAAAGCLLAAGAFPPFAGWLLARLSVPAMRALHRLTAPVPFPVAEAAALALAALLTGSLACAAARAALRRRATPLARWLRATRAAALFLATALALLWGPAWAAPVADAPMPDAARLSRLCDSLIDGLNAACGPFPDPADSLAMAPAVAGMAGCAVKAARYPAWMALAGAWGVFVPLTGEALVDAAAPAPLIPFTAVHELTHLTGVADEGAANVAAWERCMAAGGSFADSARLWALRYAMGQLHDADPAAWQAVQNKMKDALLRTFLDCGAEAEFTPRRLSLARGNYADLAGYLVEYYGD